MRIIPALQFFVLSLVVTSSSALTCRWNESGPPNFDGPYVNEPGWNFPSFNSRRNSKTNRGTPPGFRQHECCLESQKSTHTGRFADYLDKRSTIGGLRFKESTFANEGRSFCLIGEHISRSALRNAPQLRGFIKLFDPTQHGNVTSNGYFDIGSHIHPDDLNQMNYFDLPSQAQVNKPPLTPEIVSRTNRSFDDYKRAACRWTGKFGEKFDGHTYWSRPAVTEAQPHSSCLNPYEVEVSEIHAHDIRLHNYLHVTVVAKHISKPDESKNCPTGKMKWLILEARDQRGLPVGHFTNDVPCDSYTGDKETPSGPGGIQGRAIYGTQDNIFPCMYTPRDAVTVRITKFQIEIESKSISY